MQMHDKRPLEYFLKNCIVATMRNYPYKEWQKVRINGKYRGEVVAVHSLSGEDDPKIDRFVSISGFANKQRWIAVAKKLNHGKLPKRLVIVLKEKEKKND